MEDDKVFRYRGKTVDELKSMKFEDFIQLLPSREKRKLTRGFTEQEEKLLKKVRAGERNIKTHCRDMVIIPEMIGLTIGVYNGKEFESVTIVDEMLGYRLGEFSLTRKIAKHSGQTAKKKTTIRK